MAVSVTFSVALSAIAARGLATNELVLNVSTGRSRAFYSDDGVFLIVMSWRVLVVSGQRRICAFIDCLFRMPGKNHSCSLAGYLSELCELVAYFEGAQSARVYCMPYSLAHQRLYRRLGFRPAVVEVSGGEVFSRMHVLDLNEVM